MTPDLIPIRVTCSSPLPRHPPIHIDRATARLIADQCGTGLDPNLRLGTWRCGKCKEVVSLRVRDLLVYSTGIRLA